MALVTIKNAKAHLSRLLRRVRASEEIVIARGQVPVARRILIESSPDGRVVGAARGRYGHPPDDAFAPLDDREREGWE